MQKKKNTASPLTLTKNKPKIMYRLPKAGTNYEIVK